MRARYKKFELSAEMLGTLSFAAMADEKDIELMLRRSEGREYAPGADIVRHEESADDVYFILDGRVQVTVFSREGRVITFDELTADDMFGELSTIDGQPRVASVTAIDSTRTLRMPGTLFTELVTTKPELSCFVLRRLTYLVRQLCGRVFDFHTLPVRARIRAEFLRLARARAGKDNSAILSPRPTDQDMANRVGTNREQVNRERNALTRQGILLDTDEGLVVPEIGALQAIVTDEQDRAARRRSSDRR